MDTKELAQNVLSRIDEFREQKGLTLNAFARTIDMKHATLHNQFHAKRDLSLDTVLNTISCYEELSTEWLLRGNGGMIAPNETTIELQYQERFEKLLDTIQILSETIKMKNATIDALQNELSQQKSKKA